MQRKLGKGWWALTWLGLIGLGFSSPAVWAASENDLIKAQKNIGDLVADFTLKVKSVDPQKGDFSAQGKVWLAAGRRYRVQYFQPEKQLLISDGKKRWLYLEKIKQVQIQNLPPVGDANEFFLELGGGLPQLIARCQVTRLSKQETSEYQSYRLQPKPGMGLQFVQAQIWAGKNDGLPKKLVVEAERQVEVEFKNLQVHSVQELLQHPENGLADKLFVFTPPPDAEVIEMFWPVQQ